MSGRTASAQAHVRAVVAAHRETARRTRLDVDELTVQTLRDIVTRVRDALNDDQLDRAAILLGALISLLPMRHVLVVAARSGVEIGDLRREYQRDAVDTAAAIAAVLAADRRRRAREIREPVEPAIPYPPGARLADWDVA